MLTMSQTETRLAEIDERIAHVDRNIGQVSSLIPQLANKGYATEQFEHGLTLMSNALRELRAQRQVVVRSWDGEEAPPRIARQDQRGPQSIEPPRNTSGRVSTWRAIRLRLKRA